MHDTDRDGSVAASAETDDGREQQRRDILDVAGDILAQEGIGGLSMRRIAAEADCSTQVLYTLFGGKPGIVEGLYREGFERLYRVLDAVPRADDPVRYLRALGRAFRASALENARYYGVMFQGHVPGFRPSEESREHAMRALGVLIDGVERAMRDGVFIERDPWTVAVGLFASVNGLVSTELADYGLIPDAETADRLYEETMDAALRGLRVAASDT